MIYDFDYYAGKDIKYPERPKRPTLARNPTPAAARAYADALEKFEKENEDYLKKKMDYSSALNSRMSTFISELKSDWILTDLQFETIWTVAMERGRDDGLEAVYDHFENYLIMARRFAEVTPKK